ncbi:MAG: hypothetical protein GEV06_29320, partial [Luteitalea sp.]|nr:hypothetical protein [Luteitalea sp.]
MPTPPTATTTEFASLTRPSGGFAMLAVDQREALRGMFAERYRRPVADAELTEFKVETVRRLSPHASGVLVDRQFCLDAVLAARSTLVMPLALLRDRRAGEAQTALQVLTVARDQLNADRLRCINAVTALVRGHDLGVDARRALMASQIAT